MILNQVKLLQPSGYRFSTIFVTVFLFLINFNAVAHGDLSKRIIAKSNAIKIEPNNSKLYFERGFLYQQHHEFSRAIKDYLKSEDLGNKNGEIDYRKAEAYFYNYEFEKALLANKQALQNNAIDVKLHKLNAKILFELEDYKTALTSYNYFFENALDVKPGDVIFMSDIVLAITPGSYSKALLLIDNGLAKVGKNTLSLQLKKLDLLERSNKIEAVISQYNYFIVNNNRNEFWYYKKAKYLFEEKLLDKAKIALIQSKIAISNLPKKFQDNQSIKNLLLKISELETRI